MRCFRTSVVAVAAGVCASACGAAASTQAPTAVVTAHKPAATAAEQTAAAARVPVDPIAITALDGAVVVAARNGIWRSTHADGTWTHLADVLDPNRVTDITADGSRVAVYVQGDDDGGQVQLLGADETAAHLSGPAGPTALTFHGSTVIASANSIYATMSDTDVARSADGGHRWTVETHLPPSSGRAAWLPGTQTVFMPMRPNTATCLGQIYRSGDDGKTWAPVSGTCSRDTYRDIVFIDARHGFAVGGRSHMDDGHGAQTVWATSDAGRTWQLRFRGPASRIPADQPAPFVRTYFSDADHGWAITGGCDTGQNGPCGGAIFATNDGGRSWTDRGGRNVIGLAPLDTGGVIAAEGRGHSGLPVISPQR